jgi:hypothetical protein
MLVGPIKENGMSASSKCPKCESTKVIPDAYLREQTGHTVEIVAQSRPDAKLFKKGTIAKVRALICGSCGYVELFMPTYQEFYKEYQSKAD